MVNISLLPVIDIYKEKGYSITEDEDSFVLMEEENGEDKVMIPKYETNEKDYLTTLNLKFNRIILKENDERIIEDLNFKKEIIKTSSIKNEDILSFRIPEKENVSLDFIGKLTNKLFHLSKDYGTLAGQNKYSDKFNFLPTSKGSFVINIALPKDNYGEPIFEGHATNDKFIDIISNINDLDEDQFFSRQRNNKDNMKSLVKGLREFSQEILGKAEIYHTDTKKIEKIINIMTETDKKEILNKLKEIEDGLNNLQERDNIEFKILTIGNPIGNRITKLELLTASDNTADSDESNGTPNGDFIRSGVPNDIFSYAKNQDRDNNSFFLKNIQYIKLKNYNRILSAELEERDSSNISIPLITAGT